MDKRRGLGKLEGGEELTSMVLTCALDTQVWRQFGSVAGPVVESVSFVCFDIVVVRR